MTGFDGIGQVFDMEFDPKTEFEITDSILIYRDYDLMSTF